MNPILCMLAQYLGYLLSSCCPVWDPMDCSMPGFSILYYLPEFAQIYVQVALVVKNPSATWVQSLGQEDTLEKGMATHSSISAWRIPWTEEPGGLQSIGSQRVGHNWNDLAHMSIESVMSSNCPILCQPLLLLPSAFPSIRVCSNELALLIRWTKYWSICFWIYLY